MENNNTYAEKTSAKNGLVFFGRRRFTQFPFFLHPAFACSFARWHWHGLSTTYPQTFFFLQSLLLFLVRHSICSFPFSHLILLLQFCFFHSLFPHSFSRLSDTVCYRQSIALHSFAFRSFAFLIPVDLKGLFLILHRQTSAVLTQIAFILLAIRQQHFASSTP